MQQHATIVSILSLQIWSSYPRITRTSPRGYCHALEIWPPILVGEVKRAGPRPLSLPPTSRPANSPAATATPASGQQQQQQHTSAFFYIRTLCLHPLGRSRAPGSLAGPLPLSLAGPSLAGWLHCWLAPLYRWTVPLSLAGLPLLLAGLSLLHLCYPGWTSNPTLTDTQAGPTLAPSLTYSLSLGFTLLYSFAPQLSLLSNRGNSPSSSTLCLLALIVWHNKAAYLCRISTYVLLMFQY